MFQNNSSLSFIKKTYVKRDYQASQIFVKNCFTSNYSKVLNICQSVCAGAGGGPDSGASQASFSLWMIILGRQLWLMSGGQW